MATPLSDLPDLPDLAVDEEEGPILGWRAWRIGEMPGIFTRDERGLIYRKQRARPLLLSLNGTVWKPREEMKWHDGGPCKSAVNDGQKHPSLGCSCGVYAHALREQTMPELKVEMDRAGKQPHNLFAFGRVALRGHYVRGTKGYRAAFAYPYDIYLIDVGDEKFALEIASLYAIDVQHGPAPLELRPDSDFQLEVADPTQAEASPPVPPAGNASAPASAPVSLPPGTTMCAKHGPYTSVMCPRCLMEVRPRRRK